MQAYQRSNFGTLGREAKQKLRTDNDVKILVVGSGSQTGIGKTTLAVQLCRFIDDDWSAEKRAFIDINEYLNAYLDVPPGSALLLDEIEHGADSRRSTSKENVNLSQGWAKLRARNVATVATLPSVSMLDKRMVELADWWVLVKKRGLAQPYRINVNDFKPKRMPQRKPLPGDEHISFVDLPDDDPDKQYLDNIKDQIIRSEGPMTIYKSEHKEKLQKAKKETRKDTRDELIKKVYRNTSATTSEIANAVDLSQSSVSQKVSDIDPKVENQTRQLRNAAIAWIDENTDLNRSEIASIDWVDITPSTVGRVVNNQV